MPFSSPLVPDRADPRRCQTCAGRGYLYTGTDDGWERRACPACTWGSWDGNG